MKWLSNDTPSEPVENGDNSVDFYSVAQERGRKKYLNWPTIGAILIAIVLLLLFASNVKF